MEEVETPQKQTKENWLKVTLFSVAGLSILCGAIYAGYWYATWKSAIEAPVLVSTLTPTSTPEQGSSSTHRPTAAPTSVPSSSVKEQTEDWKTFANSKYHYQFKYPGDWVLGPEPKALHSEILSSRSARHPSDPAGTFVVSVRTVPLDNYVVAMEAYATEPTVPIVVDRIKGKKVIRQGADGEQYIIGVYLPFDNLTYDLSGYMKNNLSVKKEFIPIFDQILLSFKFLD